MGSQFRNSRVSIEVKITSYIFRNNAKQGFLIKKQNKDRKEISEPNNKQLQEQKGKKMQVNVHYISLVKSYTNTSQDEFTLPEKTVLSELLDKIAKDYGKPFTQEVYDPIKKEMKASYVAMVNGVLMGQLQGVNTPLKDRDSVILMSLVTGG
jgi:molybdopterin converting factor small subunit